MRLLIGGASSKLFHLRELGNALTKFGIEYRLVKDVDVYGGFPDGKYTHWMQTLAKFKELIKEFKPDAVLIDRPGSYFGLATLKTDLPLLIHLRGDFWSEVKWVRETLYTKPHTRFALWWRKRIAEKCFKNATLILPICKYLENTVKL
ncbi:MAG: glycosyltransferase family 1 protein, partial [Nitrososphaerota archaeon]